MFRPQNLLAQPGRHRLVPWAASGVLLAGRGALAHIGPLRRPRAACARDTRSAATVLGWLAAGSIVSLVAAAGPVRPLAAIDFATGTARHLRVVGTPPAVVNVDGHRVLELSPERASLPMTWSADMPSPGFPGVDPSRKPEPPLPATLVLDLDEAALGLDGPQDLAFVITVYDRCEGNSGNNGVSITWVAAEAPGSRGTGEFRIAGDPYASDALYRPRLLRKTVPAPRLLGGDGLQPGDIRVQCSVPVCLQSFEVYRLPPSPLTDAAARRGPAFISYPQYRAPASVLDVWQRDFSDLLPEQTRAYIARVEAEDRARTALRHAAWAGLGQWRTRRLGPAIEALGRLVEASALAVDAVFYDGKVALVRQDPEEYARLLDLARRSLAGVISAAAELTELAADCETRGRQSLASRGLSVSESGPPALPATTDRASPLDRILFTTFANSPWDYWDPFNATARWLGLFDIRTKGYLLGAPALGADGAPEPRSLEHYRNDLRREQACGFDVAIGVGHHDQHLTTPEFPEWLRERAAPEALTDQDAAGQPRPRAMDIWDPQVRQYFQEALTALARETVRSPHVVPWFYFGEPACGRGYSPAARRTFTRYLEQRFGTIAALNTAWGSSHVSFAEIEPPPAPGTKLRTSASGVTYEFERFRRTSFVQWWKEAAAALRRGDPRARLWLEGWGRYDYLLQHGMDQLGLFEVADLSAVHTSGAQDCQRTWQLALSRYSGTPAVDGEIVIYGPYYQGFATQEQLRAAAEANVLAQCWYGARLFMFWADSFTMARVYSYGGPTLYDGAPVSPMSSCGAAIRVVRNKADLYDALIRATRPVQPEVGILYSSTSFIDSWPYNELEHETLPMHSWLYQSDYGCAMVHEDAIVDGREDLAAYRVILAPWAVWLQPEAATALLGWVRRGGVLISSGPVGAFDPWGKPLNTVLEPLLGQVWQVRYAAHERTGDNRLSDASIARLRQLGDQTTTHLGGWVWAIDLAEPRAEARTVLALADGTPVLYESDLGYGKALIATGPLGKNGLRRLVLREIERRVRPLVRRCHDDGFHVLPRTDAGGRLFLGVFNQNANLHVRDTLWVDGGYPEVRELSLTGAWPVPCVLGGESTRLELSLAPGEGTVLALGRHHAHTPTPRDRRVETEPEPALMPGPTDTDLAKAEAAVTWRPAAADVKGEALALLLAARRHASFGYPERADRLRDLALALRARPERPVAAADRVMAVRATGPVGIDGRADEWRTVPRYGVRGRAEAGGEFALQWDQENLYLLALVRDATPRLVEEEGSDVNWIWMYDGILLVLDPATAAPLTVGGALYDAKYRAAQTALLVSRTGRKYANSACGFSAAAVRSAVGPVEGGYVLEVEVPLREVMLAGRGGVRAGFELKIVDNGSEMGYARFAERESWLFDPLHLAELELRD